MKKYFILAAVALLSLAACNKIDPENPTQEKRAINFSAVAAKTTKAPITGTTYKTTDPHFGIFCYALTGTKTWAANSADGQLYMNNVEISYNSTDKIWEPTTTYYWPLSGSLTFVGYSPYGCAGTVTYVPGTKTFTVTNFLVNADADAQEDLMWASTNPDLSNNQSTYTSESATSTLEGVNEVFHHALSQVKFNIKKAAGLDDYTITVNSITFDAYSKGTLTIVNDGTPTWSAQAKQDDFVFNTEGTDVVAPNNSAEFAAFGKANMTVPQTLVADTQTFTLTYSLTKGGVDLGQKTIPNLDLLGGTVDTWAANTIYNYNIVIDLAKIYFNPTIEEWTAGSSQLINAQ